MLALLQERPGPLNYLYFNVMVFLLTYYKFEGKSSVSIVSSSVKHSDPVQVSDALQCSWNRSDTLWHISFHTSNFWCFRHDPLCCARVHVVVSTHKTSGKSNGGYSESLDENCICTCCDCGSTLIVLAAVLTSARPPAVRSRLIF